MSSTQMMVSNYCSAPKESRVSGEKKKILALRQGKYKRNLEYLVSESKDVKKKKEESKDVFEK